MRDGPAIKSKHVKRWAGRPRRHTADHGWHVGDMSFDTDLLAVCPTELKGESAPGVEVFSTFHHVRCKA